MSRIVRYEFLGSWLWFWLACLSGLGIPLAILYLINQTIRIEEDIDDPTRFVAEYRAGRLKKP